MYIISCFKVLKPVVSENFFRNTRHIKGAQHLKNELDRFFYKNMSALLPFIMLYSV